MLKPILFNLNILVLLLAIIMTMFSVFNILTKILWAFKNNKTVQINGLWTVLMAVLWAAYYYLNTMMWTE